MYIINCVVVMNLILNILKIFVILGLSFYCDYVVYLNIVNVKVYVVEFYSVVIM